MSGDDLAGLQLEPMNQAHAEEVASWSYPRIYAFYDFAADADDLAELLDADSRRDRYFVATVPGRGVIGFVETVPADDGAVEIGLGLRPDCTGRGLRLEFVTRVCAWAQRRFGARLLVLGVAAFNARAITVYERAGFARDGTEHIQTNGTSVRFVRMERPANRA